MSSKVVPIRGRHESATSLLADAMANPNCKKVLVLFFDDDGGLYRGEFGINDQEKAYIAAFLLHESQGYD